MAFAGCDNKEVVNVPVDGIKMTLATDCPELVTRATEPGDDDLNENLISSIHYYFFDTTTSTNDTTYVFDGVQNVNSTGSAEFALSGITNTIYDNIFSSGSRTALYVYVVANAGSATLPSGTGTDLDGIRKAVLALTDFGKQDNFVMTGAGTLAYTGSGSNKTAETNEIKLSRVASKLTMHLIIPNSYTDLATKEWIPQLNKIQIDFKNIGKNGLVGGAVPTTPITPVFANVTRKGSNVDDLTSELTSDAKSTEVSLTVPVYSYPREWENGDASTPYIYITLPWVFGAVESPTYYKILLPGNSLDSNCWYDISATLGGLGSLTKEGTTTVPLTIKISPIWKDAIPDANNTEADMAMPRVLAVEQNKYILYNEDEIVIPFVSSHNCAEISSAEITVTQWSHDGSVMTATIPTGQEGAGNKQTPVSATVDNEKRTVTFRHALRNDQSSKPYDYLVFNAKFTLRHSDDDNYKEVIEIEQRPALCVEQFYNGDSFRNVFVNGTQEQVQGTTYNEHKWSILRGNTSGGGGSYNPNVLTITASVLPTTGSMAGYRIGDPRIRTNSLSLSSSPFNTVPGTTFNSGGTNYTQPGLATDSNGESLEYYYTAGPETADIVAPSFRISSSNGGTGGEDFGGNSYNYLQLRCAAYQEAGYPAGRWRLPTVAELTYCLQLQADKCLGNGIFKTDVYYMSASGIGVGIYSNEVKTNTSATNIRCVYDAWYWDNTGFPRLNDNEYLYKDAEGNILCGDVNGNYKFVWGDAPISW